MRGQTGPPDPGRTGQPAVIAVVSQRQAVPRREVKGNRFPPQVSREAGPENEERWALILEEEMNNDRQVAFRLPSVLVDRLDAYAERLRQENPGIRVSRADAVRLLLTRALEAVENVRTTDS